MQQRIFISIVVLSCVALLAGKPADGACVVLRDGTALEARTAPERRGDLVVFRDRNGRLTSMRADGIDAAATAAASRGGVCTGVAAGTLRVPQALASPLRDTARPIVIVGPSGVGPHVPNAGEIGAAMSVSAPGKRVGPPRGFSIDCGVVECGKKQHDPPRGQQDRADRAGAGRAAAGRGASAGAERSAPSVTSPASAPGAGSSARRSLFGDGFHWSDRAEEPAPVPVPAPRQSSRRKSPHHG